MKYYVGLDVSLKETHICVVDEKGAIATRGREVTQPELLASAIRKLAPEAELVVLETGGQSSWLEQELSGHGINAVIVDARQAKAVLKCRGHHPGSTNMRWKLDRGGRPASCCLRGAKFHLQLNGKRESEITLPRRLPEPRHRSVVL